MIHRRQQHAVVPHPAVCLLALCTLVVTACEGGGGGPAADAGYDTDAADQGVDRSDAALSCLTEGCSGHGACLAIDGGFGCVCREDRYAGSLCDSCAGGHTWFNSVCALESMGRAAPDRSYDWYRTQMGTGVHEHDNCGPTSVSMSMKWFDEALDVDPGAVRERITGGEAGWWYTTDIESALDAYAVPFAVKALDSIDALRAEIDAGYVLILCLTMDMISRQFPPDDSHFDRFYAYDSGHFVVAKGYMEDGLWLDIHDPNNWESDYYMDGEPFGKDRFYSGDEVVSSARVWWPFMIVIGEEPTRGLNTSEIPVGRSGP